MIYSVMDSEVRDQVIDPHLDCEWGQETSNNPPLYFLHYDDIHFANPHYQSIWPKPNFNVKLPTRVNNLIRNMPAPIPEQVCIKIQRFFEQYIY